MEKIVALNPPLLLYQTLPTIMKIRILTIFLILILACKQSEKETQVGITTDKSKSELNNQTKVIIPENVDSEFNLFLEFFSSDSTFQISRVNFPLKVKHLDIENGILKNRIIEPTDYYLKRFLPFNNKNQDYTQEIDIKNDKVIIFIRGIENGLVVDYEFDKIHGKWKLITWTDQST